MGVLVRRLFRTARDRYSIINLGILYFITGAWRGILGTGLRILIRREQGQSGPSLGNDQLYNVIVTAHAFVIIFFTGIPILIRGKSFGNCPTPPKLGAPDMAAPWLNKISFWFLLPAFSGGRGAYLFKREWQMRSLATTVGGWKVIKNENKRNNGLVLRAVYLRDKKFFQDILFKR